MTATIQEFTPLGPIPRGNSAHETRDLGEAITRCGLDSGTTTAPLAIASNVFSRTVVPYKAVVRGVDGKFIGIVPASQEAVSEGQGFVSLGAERLTADRQWHFHSGGKLCEGRLSALLAIESRSRSIPGRYVVLFLHDQLEETQNRWRLGLLVGERLMPLPLDPSTVLPGSAFNEALDSVTEQVRRISLGELIERAILRSIVNIPSGSSHRMEARFQRFYDIAISLDDPEPEDEDEDEEDRLDFISPWCVLLALSDFCGSDHALTRSRGDDRFLDFLEGRTASYFAECFARLVEQLS